MAHPTDLTLLIDAPPGSAAALRDTLDFVGRHRAEARGWHVLVTLRGQCAATAAAAIEHPAAPLLLELPAGCPADPAGQVLAALVGRFTLALGPGVVPDEAGETLPRMLRYLGGNPAVAALSGPVLRGDGTAESHALPGALHGGAVLLRNEALRRVGGQSRLMPPGGPADLDLSCRLLRGGYGVERYEDLRFDRARWPDVSVWRDDEALRDSLIVVERFLPRPMRHRYRRDAVAHARARTRLLGMTHDLAKAAAQARRWAQWERKRGRSTLPGEALEGLLGWGSTKREVVRWASRERVRRVVIAGWHPNVYATYRAAGRAGLTVSAIADDAPMLRGAAYRGVPVLPVRDAIDARVDGVLLADACPATAERLAQRVTKRFAGPVLRCWTPRVMETTSVRAESPLSPTSRVA